MRRALIAFIIIIILAIGFLVPSLAFIAVLLIAILGVISVRELAQMFEPTGIDVSKRVSTTILVLLILMAWFRQMDLALSAVGMVVILGFLWRMFRDPIEGSFRDISGTCGAALYIGVPIALMIDLFLQGDAGKIWLAFMLTTVWATDTGAYFFGRKFGSRKLYPRLSPNKTVEGALGGICAAYVPLIIGFIFFPNTIGIQPVLYLVFLSTILAVLIEIGDMAESLLKREAGVKDSGTVLAGHGGALDRMDSMLFVCVPFILFLRLMHPEVFAT